jgi:hypothetical protein
MALGNSRSNENQNGFHALTFDNSLLRQDERMDQKLKPQSDATLESEARRKAAVRRTAWIVAAIAAAFFIASLVQGHLAHIPR